MKRSGIVAVFLSLPAILFIFFSSCSLFTRTNAVLWTSVPEFASYTEVYNSQQDSYKIELVYKEDPAAELETTQEQPDLIVAERLSSVKLIDQFSSLEKMYKDEILDPALFYRELLEQGVYEEEQVLLPVSFRLPMILYAAGREVEGDEDLSLSFNELRMTAEQFKVESEELPEVLSFVTYWEPQFLYYTSYLEGADFRESLSGELLWNARSLSTTISKLEEWSTDINGSLDIERQFSERYLYNPGYKLVNTGRIVFYYTDIRHYFNIPKNKRENLEFRWYGKEQENPIADDILFLGMYKRGRSRKAAQNFIEWFFTVKTQQELLENSENKRIRTFGIAQGFSSLIQLNERDIPRYFPEMTGKIIPADYISSPPPLPLEWNQIKREVLIPWLRNKIVNSAPESFEDRMQTWHLQSPDR